MGEVIQEKIEASAKTSSNQQTADSHPGCNFASIQPIHVCQPQLQPPLQMQMHSQQWSQGPFVFPAATTMMHQGHDATIPGPYSKFDYAMMGSAQQPLGTMMNPTYQPPPPPSGAIQEHQTPAAPQPTGGNDGWSGLVQGAATQQITTPNAENGTGGSTAGTTNAPTHKSSPGRTRGSRGGGSKLGG